ncbi:very short patch repair endonuclease [Bradyrhizobium sp. SZCCHNPS1003]|uniref:very short patch repair endonuclease n=1 Tax=Bradyrhizobium sp. SZCCHNPS1003 TaxID=3057330 RepID=UPI0028E38D7B|nr:very short patch repair endonuclease [Bradyrhizobium sp. SZCCHNPS1003]
MDKVDKVTRSRIMASVGQRDTGVEMMLRSALHRLGVRYRLHVRSLPGSPDLVFPRYRAVVFVHGCYWHAHGCHRSTFPRSNQSFWSDKFAANQRRDAKKEAALLEAGWRVMTVWECALRGKTSRQPEEVATAISKWLRSRARHGRVGPPPTQLLQNTRALLAFNRPKSAITRPPASSD